MSDRPSLPARLRDAESPGEGTVFAIPLPRNEYVLGVVIARYPRVIRIGLIPDPVADLPPSAGSVSPSDLEIITQVGAEALDNRKWPVVGVLENFVAAKWPNPPMLPGDRADKAQSPDDLEREMVKTVHQARRRQLNVAREEELIPVDQEQGRGYAELALSHGPLLAKLVRDSLDFDAGAFGATAAFIEHERGWQTGEVDPGQIVTGGGWTRGSNYYEKRLVPILHRFLADPNHSAVFHHHWLELPRDTVVWQRIETERFGPLEIFPLQFVFRDEGSKRELYAAVGGGEIDEATAESLISRTFEPVLNVIFMVDVPITSFPPHAHPIDEERLVELARHVKGLALRFTSYDGYLIWQRS